MSNSPRWQQYLNFWYGVPITLLVLSLFYYWFRIANRSIVFLVNHDMGPLIASTAPFSFITRSRYWMAGFVASGAVMVLYFTANFTMRFLNRTYTPPAWISVWIIPAIGIALGIPLITMTTANAPALPPEFALWVTAVTLAGLALAFLPGTYAGQHPVDAIFLTVDGTGLSFILIGAPAIEDIAGWLDRGAWYFVIYAIVLILAGLVITLSMTALRFMLKWRGVPALTLFLAGLCLTYPGLSILHHVFFTDGYFYISDSDNFFARNAFLQVGIWIATALFCYALANARQRFAVHIKYGSARHL